MDRAHVLYVEDDVALGFVTRDSLEQAGYRIVHATDAEQALEFFQTKPFDICVIDVMLPKMDGFALAMKIREQNKHIPILFLTALSLKEDRIKGLTIGGDDYIVKPFSIEELILKIEIFMKRKRIHEQDHHAEEAIQLAGYRFFPDRMFLEWKGEKQVLTYKESELLRFFTGHINRIVRREEILTAVWGDDTLYLSRTLDVFISRLRKYLSKDTSIELKNVHSIGFRLSLSYKESE
ncbi:MAG TPA: response regulator transcription factor [Bacteroidales bacterium]|nr:response regulator transcription factor [Bacteroidales bacterium]